MIVTHEAPEGWPADTGEAGKVQPSHVAGMGHVVQIEPEDMPQSAESALTVRGSSNVQITSGKVTATLRWVSIQAADGKAVHAFSLTISVLVAQTGGVKVQLPAGAMPEGAAFVSCPLLGPDATARVAKLSNSHLVVGAAYAGTALASVPAGTYFASGVFL